MTLRRIGEELEVRPGLVSHYFPSAELLVAEAFGSAATGELDALLPQDGPGHAAGIVDAAGDGPGEPATTRLSRFFTRTTGPAWDDISRLWINARHLSRYRPALRERVVEQEAMWRARLTALIADGTGRGEFRTPDPEVVAMQILVVLDGLGADAGAGSEQLPPAVTRMAVTLAERELGLPRGVLGPLEP